MTDKLKAFFGGLRDLLVKAEEEIFGGETGTEVVAEVKKDVEIVKEDLTGLAESGWNYIKNHGLHDLYAIAQDVLIAAVSGSPWAVTLTAIKAKAMESGAKLIEGAESVVAAQAQADLIAAGKLMPPADTVAQLSQAAQNVAGGA